MPVTKQPLHWDAPLKDNKRGSVGTFWLQIRRCGEAVPCVTSAENRCMGGNKEIRSSLPTARICVYAPTSDIWPLPVAKFFPMVPSVIGVPAIEFSRGPDRFRRTRRAKLSPLKRYSISGEGTPNADSWVTG
jgi:hypothetical protein